MIRFAQTSDRARLMALWAEIFGDSEEDVEAYFARRHRDGDMLVFVEDGVLCGMLSMLTLTLVSRDAEYPARYVYAVATDPIWRGRGIASRLLEEAHAVMRARGAAASVLVPASGSLFDYYGKRGYRAAFTLDIVDFSADSIALFPAGGAFSTCEPAEYARLRDRAFAGQALYARWDEAAVAFACAGMGLTKLSLGAGIGCALWENTGDEVLVRELALVGMDVPAAIAVLHGAIGSTRYRVRLRGAGVPFGMIRWLIPEPKPAAKDGYLSLALD